MQYCGHTFERLYEIGTKCTYKFHKIFAFLETNTDMAPLLNLGCTGKI